MSSLFDCPFRPGSIASGRLLHRSLLTLSLAAVGCADEAERASADLVDIAALRASGASDAPRVTATGSGCPRGTWSAAASRDGTLVTVRFREFAGERVDDVLPTKDCDLRISLPGGGTISYAPAEVVLSGSARDADLVTTATWAGSDRPRNFRDGVRSDFEETHEAEDFWSPCGKAPALRLQTTASLTRGTFALTNLELTFASKRCAGDQRRDASVPTPPSPGPDARVPDGRADNSTSDTFPRFGAGGTSCSSADTKLSADGSTYTATFSKYGSEVDASSTIGPSSCVLSLPVSNGAQTYAVESVTYTTSSTLAANTALELRSAFSFTGGGLLERADGSTIGKSTVINGPQEGESTITHEFTGGDLTFIPCGPTTRQPHVNTFAALNVLGSGGMGKNAVKSVSVKVAQRACPAR